MEHACRGLLRTTAFSMMMQYRPIRMEPPLSPIMRVPCNTREPASLPTIFPHCIRRFVDNVGCGIECRTETDRVFARTKSQDSEIEEAFPEFLPRFCVGQIEGEKQSPAARSGNQRFFALQIAELIQKICAHLRGVLNQMFFLDDPQKMRRAHHVGEIAAPG